MIGFDDRRPDLLQDRENLLAGLEIKTVDVIQLLGGGRRNKFVPQAIVDRELGRELPIILDIEIVRVKAEVSLRGPQRADHVGRIAKQEIGHRVAAARHRVAVLRIQRRRVAGREGEAAPNTVVGVEEHARLTDVEPELDAVSPTHDGHAVGNVVVVQDAALRQAVAADAGESSPAYRRNSPVSLDSGDSRDADLGSDVRRNGYLLAEQVRVAMVEPQHVDDGRRKRGCELSHLVIGARDDLAAAVGDQCRRIERGALPSLPRKQRMPRVNEPVDPDALLVVIQFLDRRSHQVRALYSGAIGDRDIWIEFLGDRIDAGGWNHVARENLAGPGGRIEGHRIINEVFSGEVAAQQLLSRKQPALHAAQPLEEALVASEHEELVLQNRRAYAAA